MCVCAAVSNLVCQYAIKFYPQVTVKRFFTLLVGETTQDVIKFCPQAVFTIEVG